MVPTDLHFPLTGDYLFAGEYLADGTFAMNNQPVVFFRPVFQGWNHRGRGRAWCCTEKRRRLAEKLRLLPRSQREKLANYATVGLIALCTLVVGYWFVFVS